MRMSTQPNHGFVPDAAGQDPARKRGRPAIPVSEEVLEHRRLSRQRVNAQRSEDVAGQGPSRKRGRPPIPVTEEVLEQRRLSRQWVNAQRSKGEATSRSRGRPRGSRNKSNLVEDPLSVPHPSCVSDEGVGVARGDAESCPQVGVNATARQVMPVKESLLGEESRRMRRSMDRKKKEFMETNTILTMGKQEETCGYCKAQLWAAEFTGRHVGTGRKG